MDAMLFSAKTLGRPLRRLKTAATLILLATAPAAAFAADAALADAVQAQNQSLVVALIARHVDVNAPQADGTTALHWAAHQIDLQMADQLLRAGARVTAANRYGVTPLALAAAHGNGVEMMEKLLKAGADPNTTLK